jgi:predicted anti-sigma-YlaC factor YlaD
MNVENEFANRACAEYEAALEDYLGGTLENGVSRKVAEHLRACVGCSAALADAAAASQMLRGVERAADPGPAFTHMVMARVRTAESESRAGFWDPFVSLAWKFATTAALALVVMLAFATHGTSSRAGTSNNVAAIAPSGELQDILVAGQSMVPATRSDLVRMVTESDNAQQ